MRSILLILFLLVVSVLSACISSQEGEYQPSIASLAQNETLFMKLQACHWDCTQGTVRFKNGKAILGRNSLKLTSQEVLNLDNYFASGLDLVLSERCSLPIEISFVKKINIRSLKENDARIYPCSFGGKGEITPIDLVHHFKEMPNETPYWRMTPEEQRQYQDLLDGREN